MLLFLGASRDADAASANATLGQARVQNISEFYFPVTPN